MALIVFTVIFSIAVIMAGEKGKPIVRAMDSLTAVIVNVINIVMKLAPLGLGCYFAILIGKYPDGDQQDKRQADADQHAGHDGKGKTGAEGAPLNGEWGG